MENLTVIELKEVLDYDPDSGEFIWLNAPNNRYVKNGDIAGTLADGYIRIKIRGKKYAAHRLAWLYMTENWPSGEIDHINGIKYDNRYDNLRTANRSENRRNVSCYSGSPSGLKGVTKWKGRWRARISINKKQVWLGYYNDPIEAAKSYDRAAIRYHGEYAKLNFPRER